MNPVNVISCFVAEGRRENVESQNGGDKRLRRLWGVHSALCLPKQLQGARWSLELGAGHEPYSNHPGFRVQMDGPWMGAQAPGLAGIPKELKGSSKKLLA